MREWAGTLMVPVVLYIVAVALLTFNLNTQPNFTYNWENNTLRGLYPFVEQPSLSPFKILEGLMTDSGSSPLILFPAWISFGFWGPSLIGLRLPVTLLVALAVPLLYLLAVSSSEFRVSNSELGIRDQGSGIRGWTGLWPVAGRRSRVVGITSALLLALSPVFMLYARTATVVGISVVPALLTVPALFGVMQRPDLWWRSAGLLGLLMVGAYGYAPIRFLWPMCVVLLLLEAFMRRKAHNKDSPRLAASAVLLVVGMVGFITAFDFDHEHNPIVSVGYYYSGRGEQIANLLVSVEDYNEMAGAVAPGLDMSPLQLAWELFTKNVSEMTNLFLDIGTSPALSDFWSPRGRLIPWWLAPLLFVGLLRAARWGLRRDEFRWRAIVLLFLGFTLPMLATSQVHIGRLIFAVPFICLFVAVGGMAIADWGLRIADLFFSRRQSNSTRNPKYEFRNKRGLAALALSVGLVGGVAYSTWQDYTIPVPLTYEAAVTRILAARLGEVKARGGGVALVTNDDGGLILEAINANQYRLMLRDRYHLFNLATGDIDIRRPGDTRPALYIGGMIDRIKEPLNVPEYCKNLYYVTPDLEAAFLQQVDRHKDLCPEPVLHRLLP